MAKNYPRIVGHRRKPQGDRDGSKNYGKPCVVCGTWKADYMRPTVFNIEKS